MNVATYTYTARRTPEAHDRRQAACVALAHDLGLDVTRSYSDEAGTRPALARLLSDASAGRVTVLVVANLDRLGRTVPATPQIVADLYDADVTIYAANRGTRPLIDRTTLPDILTATIQPHQALTRARRHRRRARVPR